MHVHVVHVCMHLLGSCDLKRREVLAILGPLAARARRSRLSAALAQSCELWTHLLNVEIYLPPHLPTCLPTSYLPTLETSYQPADQSAYLSAALAQQHLELRLSLQPARRGTLDVSVGLGNG